MVFLSYLLVSHSTGLFIQNPWIPSCPDVLQFAISLHCFFTLWSLITTFCCSNFTIFSFRWLNYLVSLLFSFSTLVIPFQNVLLSSALAMSLLLLPISPLNSLKTFFWSTLKNLLILYCWILCLYWDILAAFASILWFNSSVAVFKPFLFTPYFSWTRLALTCLCARIFPFFNILRMLKSFSCCFISSTIRLFPYGSFFFLPSSFLRPNWSAIQAPAVLIRLFA